MSERVGKVCKIQGGMFSGKSTELLRRVRRLELADKVVQMFTPKANTRSPTNTVESRDLGTREAIMIESVHEIFPLLEDDTDVIALDEVQFLPDIEVFCNEATQMGYDVIVSGLDYTFKGEPFRMDGFGCILDVLAEVTVQLYAVCMQRGCDEDAMLTERIVGGDAVKIVGDSESYRAVCRKHFGTFRVPSPCVLCVPSPNTPVD